MVNGRGDLEDKVSVLVVESDGGADHDMDFHYSLFQCPRLFFHGVTLTG